MTKRIQTVICLFISYQTILVTFLHWICSHIIIIFSFFFFFGRSHTPLKLKRWHRVRISRTGLLAEVQVDDKKKVAQLATGAFTQVLTLISILSCSWNLGAYY